jgi:cytochrome b pre-mRNA-processing protein 3
MGIWPFTRSAASRDAEAVLSAVTAASRSPSLYGAGRAPDTLEGRFEMLTVFASLALVRFQNDAGAKPLAQHFTDKLFRLIDSGLREAAVGDTTVPKRMRKLAGDFYGRLNAYSAALKAEDRSALAAAIVRNIGVSEAFAAELAEIAAATAARQKPQNVAALAEADSWVAA